MCVCVCVGFEDGAGTVQLYALGSLLKHLGFQVERETKKERLRREREREREKREREERERRKKERDYIEFQTTFPLSSELFRRELICATSNHSYTNNSVRHAG